MGDPRDTDLFGNPVRARKGLRGRPKKEFSEKDLDMLEAALAKGWTNTRIADALDVGVSTLKRNFGPVLRMREVIPDRLELALFASAVRKAVERGDAGAIRQVRQMISDERINDAGRRFDEAQRRDVDPPEVKERQLGKKEAAQRAAETAGGAGSLWGNDLTPGFGRPN